MMHPRWLLLLLCATLLVGPTQAESGDPWYEIELIVFARNAADSGLSETWPQEPGTPDWSTAHTIQDGFSPMAPSPQPEAVIADATAPAEATAPSTAILVPKSAYQLSGAVSRLNKTAGRLEPLLHLAWRQPVQNRDSADPIYVQSPSHIPASAGFPQPSRLEGTVKISLSRYLHINLDLLLRERAALNDPSSTSSMGDYAIATSPYRSYRMQDHRRMRSNELHYIDHPLMGVLVEIRPYEVPQSEPIPPAPIVLPKTAAPTAEPIATPSAVSQPATPAE